MKVYSLTGVSGTGKSFQALNLCDELKINAIVDDGLFIYNEKVEAGHSAKREKTNDQRENDYELFHIIINVLVSYFSTSFSWLVAR